MGLQPQKDQVKHPVTISMAAAGTTLINNASGITITSASASNAATDASSGNIITYESNLVNAVAEFCVSTMMV